MESSRPLIGFRIKQECNNVSLCEEDNYGVCIITSSLNHQDITNIFPNESFVHGQQLAEFSAVSQCTSEDEITIDYECEDVKPSMEFLHSKMSVPKSDSKNMRVKKYTSFSNIVEAEAVSTKKNTMTRANDKNETCKRERHRKTVGQGAFTNKGAGAVRNRIKRHECYKCHKKFGKKDVLKRHFISIHGRAKFECDECKKVFNDKGNLRKHIHIVHIRIRPHKCDKCDKSFGLKGDLKKHIDRVHNHIKSHECKVCDKSFFKRSDLTKHVDSVHTNKSRVICDICKTSLSRKDSLRNHIKNHNNIV